MFTIDREREHWRERALKAEEACYENNRKMMYARNDVWRAEGTTAAVCLAAGELLDRLEKKEDAGSIERACAILRHAMDGEYALKLASALDASVNVYTAANVFHRILLRLRVDGDIRRAAERWGMDKLMARRIAADRHRHF